MQAKIAKAKCDDCLTIFPNLSNYEYKEISDGIFLCSECEKYSCLKCITKHTDHKTFSFKDKSGKNIFDQFCADMIEQLTSEGDKIVEKFTEERTHVCDIVDVFDGNRGDFKVVDICILRESKKWAITDKNDKCIKVFNINNNQMTKKIHLAYKPDGITEIPSTDPSQSLIAVSVINQIDIMNIKSEPPQIISSTHAHGHCHFLAYCTNKLITMCGEVMYGTNGLYVDWRNSIHVIDMSREQMEIIDLSNLPGMDSKRLRTKGMSVNSERETIYVCQYKDPACVIALSLDGQVLHYVEFTNMNPTCVCVDSDQNVYVTGYDSPLYKLSSDLSQTDTIIDKALLNEWFHRRSDRHFCNITSMAWHVDTVYIARSDGRVVIIRHE